MKIKPCIAIPTSEYARRADFYDYLHLIDMSELECGISFTHGQSPARGRNILIETALQNECTHILFLDDDVVVRPNVLKQLLAHDKDIVSGLYLMRNHPHFPVLFDEAFSDGKCKFSFLSKDRQGLVQAVNCGFGCVLIKTDVFKKMADDIPWIRLGQCERDHWCDDVDFFNRARDKYGYQIWCDLECIVGHMVSGTIFPSRKENGTWVTLATLDQQHMFELPQVVPSQDLVDKLKEEHKLSMVK